MNGDCLTEGHILGAKAMNLALIRKKLPTEADCIFHLERIRWNGKPVCPYCNSTQTSPIPREARHHCNGCNTAFSVSVGTIFHHTHLPLQKWFLAISLVLNAEKDISARQLACYVEVSTNTARFMGLRIRNATLEQGKLIKNVVGWLSTS